METERNESQARRVLLVLLAFLAVGGVGVAVGAVLTSNGDDEGGETVEVRSQTTGGEAEKTEPAEEPKAEKPDKPARDAKPAPAPASPAPVAQQDSSNETTFACKADAGEDADGCGTVYDSGGLRVEANCDASGLAALATVPHAVMTAEVMDSEGESFGSITDSSVDRGFDLASEDTPASSGTVTFTAPDSDEVIVLEFSATYSPGAPQGDCVFVGKVTEL